MHENFDQTCNRNEERASGLRHRQEKIAECLAIVALAGARLDEFQSQLSQANSALEKEMNAAGHEVEEIVGVPQSMKDRKQNIAKANADLDQAKSRYLAARQVWNQTAISMHTHIHYLSLKAATN